MPTYTLIQLVRDGPVATVTLNRPQVHNALNAEMIAELTACFAALTADLSVRIVILAGAGPSFCAGADLQWMRESLGWSREENRADAERLATMYETIDHMPKPLLARVQGAAIGGGAGLVACCDLVIASEQALFGFSEVKLGLVPAVIARFVVPKIGLSHARALFVTGARFGAARAAEIGLVHQVVAPEALDAAIATAIDEMYTSGPAAAGRSKAILRALQTLPDEEMRAYAVDAIAEARTSPEGQAGLDAFLNKQLPPWTRQ